MDASLIKEIKEKAQSLAGEMTAVRRHLHANPELSWQEVKTTRLIAEKLSETGFKDLKIGTDGKEVGLVADLTGSKDGPCIALRTDIDALGVKEEGNLPYRSAVDGVAHACGHDAHVATMLGTAKVLYSMKDRLPGKVRFIFQPAEEHGMHSGAKAMIKEGVLKGVDSIAGMHVWSHVPTGVVHWRSGPVMASVDAWEVKFQGKGGHGGMPQKAIDPTLMAANFILALQTLISRETNPLETGVVSVGKMNSGHTINVIPDTAELCGNVRTFSVAVRDNLRDSLIRIADNIAFVYRGKAETKYTELYSRPVNNDKELAGLFMETAVQVVGADKVVESPMLMTAEDFSFYQSHIPGNLFFIGCGNQEKGITAPHHSPSFNIDDDVLPIAVSMMSSYAFAALEKLSAGK
jgi:amidohydrolase